jgi:D-sedoheptulose 7-phosphate isomerase
VAAVPIASFARTIASALANGSTVFWCGNGGSAADSQHLAAELVGRFKKDRRPLRSVALTTDTSVLTCVANDYSYEDIFARQVEALSRPGDVLVGISTSGQSENILRAVKMARSLGLQTIGLLGKDGGVAKDLVDQAIVIPSESTARIQESHILIGHILCDLIEQELGLA